MQNKTLKNIAVLIVIFVLGFAIYRATRPKPDERAFLLALPAHIAALAEKQQGGEIKKFISKNYSDSKNRTFQDVGGIITAYMLRGGAISVYTLKPQVKSLDITTDPPKAHLTFQAALAQGARNAGALDLIPESASYYDFSLQMEKTDDDGWQVYSAEWEPVSIQ
ncbi:hypothetical protein [Pseudobdellovibrio exovorus]|uniref:Uncharacterized protein n=1 Tax=Pseudobdellovibrio exovorus JSS TaxID=1184267 RepID=M4VNA2_9BACT|nr:hypothetical protein [Pseudobdellovibrio exovorus]AGH94559.1 hypothetical protein A11Q_339 [Pseudobdellovibrio exovorus JSS]